MNAKQAELERQLDELRRFQKLMVGRELRMKELAEENAALRNLLAAEKPGMIQPTSSSLEQPHPAAKQSVVQPSEESTLSALLFMLEDLEAEYNKIVQAHQEWMDALDAVSDPIFLHDQQFRILRCNKAYQKCARMPFKEIIGQPYHAVFPKSSAPLASCLRALEKEGEEREEVTIGNAIYRSSHFSIHDAQGAYLYSVHNLVDITARKQVESDLREARDYLENLVNYANAPIIVWNPSNQITLFNHAFERLTGRDANQVIGKRIDILFPPDRLEEALALIDLTQAGERWESIEIPILHSSGEVRTALWNSATIYSSDGKNLIATIAQGQDITARKQVESELRETRDYLENLVNYANAPIIVWNPSNRITLFNHAFERLTGREASEVIGKRIDILFPPDRLEEALDHIDLTQAGERWESIEIPILHSSGEVKTALWNSATVYSSDGKNVVATIAQGQDITARKQVESELGETRDYLENLVNYANAPIIVWNPSNRITLFNHAFERLTGRDASEVIGMRINILFPPDRLEEALAHIHQTQTGKRWESIEIPILHSSGEVRTALWNSATIYSSDGKNVVATIAQGQDITTRKQAETNLAEQLEELRRWHDTTLGRELRILDLKHEVNELLGQAGQPPRYPSAESKDPQEE